MKPSHPPIAATRLLKFLTPAGKNEALLGDLEEDFMQGRSAAWYWRQVFSAILVNFVQELRCRRVMVGFAALWTAVTILTFNYSWQSTHVRSLLEPFYGWALRFDFPISMVIAMSLPLALETATACFGLGLCLVMMRSFTIQRFLRKSLTATSIVLLGIIGVTFAAFLIAGHFPPVLGYAFEPIPVFVGLLVAAWKPSVENRKATSISA
jgi:hypothetical protein